MTRTIYNLALAAMIAGFAAVAPAHAADSASPLLLAQAQKPAAYVAGFEDVPLMSGLSAHDGYDMVFDKPEGRIVESVVTGSVDARAVKTFYDTNLPQLGWKNVGQDRWLRSGELLQLQYFTTDAGSLGLRFTLTPSQ